MNWTIGKFNQPGQHNWTKLLCLAVGMAAGIVLIGKVGLEHSWDDFFPHSDQIYIVCQDATLDGEQKHFPQTAGAVAPGMRRYCPQVEAATRYTYILDEALIVTDDDQRLRANYALADSSFFDVFPFRVLAGNPHEVLSTADQCMIPRSLADKLGGDPVGQKLYYRKHGTLPITVGGVYEDLPLNSRLNGLEILVAMPTISKIMWDGSENWVGNDRYHSYVRLAPGTNPQDLSPMIQKMERDNIPDEEMKKAGVELHYTLTPLKNHHTNDPNTRRMTWILSLLAAMLIGCAVMNYLLLVIGSVTRRAREMAVRKCYGAEPRHIYATILAESALHLLLALALAALLLLLARPTVEQITGAPLPLLLTAGQNLRTILALSLTVLLLTGLLPAHIYNHVPIAAAFKTYSRTHRLWKQLLLALQFAAATLLILLLTVVSRQYKLMVNDNPGYDYATLAVIDCHDLAPSQRKLLTQELSKHPAVQTLTAANQMLTDHQSGDNIFLPGDERQYLNVADLYWMSDNYFQTMRIPIHSGRTFTEHTDTLAEAMVSRTFEQRMQQLAGWDQALGKRIICTSFDTPHTIVGVYDDPLLGSLAAPDTRPSICFYSQRPELLHHIIIRLHTLDKLPQLNTHLHQLLPDHPDLAATPYRHIITHLYTDARRFQTTVTLGLLVALLLALTGLIGYLAGEITRRQKEIALRKVNGARTADILHLFAADILRLALPATLLGAAAAHHLARHWLQQFSQQSPLPPSLHLFAILTVLLLILLTVLLTCRHIATSNPVNYLKSE